MYYHLSLSDSDRLMLLVHMLAKLILFFCGSLHPMSNLEEPTAAKHKN
jgi:hypothetical protein